MDIFLVPYFDYASFFLSGSQKRNKKKGNKNFTNSRFTHPMQLKGHSKKRKREQRKFFFLGAKEEKSYDLERVSKLTALNR